MCSVELPKTHSYCSSVRVRVGSLFDAAWHLRAAPPSYRERWKPLRWLLLRPKSDAPNRPFWRRRATHPSASSRSTLYVCTAPVPPRLLPPSSPLVLNCKWVSSCTLDRVQCNAGLAELGPLHEFMLELISWGPGWEGWEDTQGLQENLRLRFGSEEHFDIILMVLNNDDSSLIAAEVVAAFADTRVMVVVRQEEVGNADTDAVLDLIDACDHESTDKCIHQLTPSSVDRSALTMAARSA